jgi:hypothetical protein
MEKKKKLDVIKASNLSSLIEELNKLEVQKDDLIGFSRDEDYYLAIIYC